MWDYWRRYKSASELRFDNRKKKRIIYLLDNLVYYAICSHSKNILTLQFTMLHAILSILNSADIKTWCTKKCAIRIVYNKARCIFALYTGWPTIINF